MFTDTNGAVQDAPSVKVTWATDGGTSTTWTYGVNGQLVKDSVGNYHADLDTTGLSGRWNFEWVATGTGQTAASSQFLVSPLPL